MNRRTFLHTAGLTLPLLHPDAWAGVKNRFYDRLQPAVRGGGFQMDDYWVWCGSAVRGEDNRYHLFASRWPKALAFHPHWLSNSEIVRAVADRPEGPYQFEERVLAPRDARFWDGRMTHNPTIHRHGDKFLLFYIGLTFDGPAPTPATPLVHGSERMVWMRGRQRIGLAVADSVRGPWRRPDQPLLDVAPAGAWDSYLVSNPAPCVRPDGSVLLVYKGTGGPKARLNMGVAGADHYAGPYRRLSPNPIFDLQKTHVEDGYCWHERGRYWMVMKDMTGDLCGEKHAGILVSSREGVRWEIAQPPLAYSRTLRWDDGTTTTQGQLERPQLLMENGTPTHLFFATGDGPGGFDRMTRSWNLVVPLRH